MEIRHKHSLKMSNIMECNIMSWMRFTPNLFLPTYSPTVSNSWSSAGANRLLQPCLLDNHKWAEDGESHVDCKKKKKQNKTHSHTIEHNNHCSDIQ